MRSQPHLASLPKPHLHVPHGSAPLAAMFAVGALVGAGVHIQGRPQVPVSAPIAVLDSAPFVVIDDTGVIDLSDGIQISAKTVERVAPKGTDPERHD